MPGKRKGGKRQALAVDETLRPGKGQKTLGGSNQGGGGVLHNQSNHPQPTTSASKPPSGVDNTTQDEDRVFSIATGKSLVGVKPPSYVEVGIAPSSSSASHLSYNGDHQSKAFFEACQRNGRLDSEGILQKDIRAYVRYELFPKLKFIMNDRQLEYSPERNTICGLICEQMGLEDPKAAVSWWERYKDMIADVLNAKRADVTGAIKRAFLRKFTRWRGSLLQNTFSHLFVPFFCERGLAAA